MDFTQPFFDAIVEPLGIETLVSANDADLLGAICKQYREWRSAKPPVSPRLAVRFALRDIAAERGDGIDIEGARLTLRGAGVEGWADAQTGRAEVWISPTLLAQPAALAEVSDTLLLFLLTRNGRVPLHAAGVVVGETALLLAGPSGAGKSTLALRAMQRGLPILSDDTVYIQLQPDLRVWGLRRPLHVFPAEAPRFTQGVRLRAGRLKAVVPLTSAAEQGRFSAEKTALILLARGDHISLEPIDAGFAAAALSHLDPGFDLLAERSAQAIAALAERGAWRLTLTSNPDAALDRLIEHFAVG